jgi:hypothetical protein
MTSTRVTQRVERRKRWIVEQLDDAGDDGLTVKVLLARADARRGYRSASMYRTIRAMLDDHVISNVDDRYRLVRKEEAAS